MLYKIRRFDLWVASFFIKAKYISLVNLLADAEVFPEYLTWRDGSDELVRWGLLWLDNPAAARRGPIGTCDLALPRGTAGRVGQIGATDRTLAGPKPRRKTRAIPALWSPRAANPVRSRSRPPLTRALSRVACSASARLPLSRVEGLHSPSRKHAAPSEVELSVASALSVRLSRTTASRGRCSSWPGAVISNFRRTPRFNFALS